MAFEGGSPAELQDNELDTSKNPLAESAAA
jgi:hypothetical protein